MYKEFNNWNYNKSQTTFKLWEPQTDSIKKSMKKNLIYKESEMMLNEAKKNS